MMCVSEYEHPLIVKTSKHNLILFQKVNFILIPVRCIEIHLDFSGVSITVDH